MPRLRSLPLDCADYRRGLTLLELTIVVSLIGVFVAVAALRFGNIPLRNFSAGADARRLSQAFLQARRGAIATGDNHFVEFTSAGGNVVGFTLYRRLSGSVQAVDAYVPFTQGETVTVSHSQAEFDFQGAGLASYEATFTGPNRTWQVTVVAATGTVRVVSS